MSEVLEPKKHTWQISNIAILDLKTKKFKEFFVQKIAFQFS